MTQEGKGFSTSQSHTYAAMNVEDTVVNKNKSPSPELLSLIKAAATSLIGFAELWGSIKKKGHDEGFSEQELQGMLKPLLRDKLSNMQIRYLFGPDQWKQHSKEQYEKKSVNINRNDVKKGIEQSDSPTPEPMAKDDEIDYEREYRQSQEAQIKPATFTKQDIDLDTVVFRMGVKDYKFTAEQIAQEMADFIKKDLPAMKNRGWSIVEVTIKVVG